MSKKNNKRLYKNVSEGKEAEEKVSLAYNLRVDELNKNSQSNEGFDFVPKDYHWTNLSEQKVKVKEIEDKTK